MQKYIDLAIDLGITDAVLITPNDIVFDIRGELKCKWGCEKARTAEAYNPRCDDRGTTLEQRQAMIKAYKHILLLHCGDKVLASCVGLDIERAAFYDGHYFACSLRYCSLCISCAVAAGKACPTPELIRPCDESFGIDLFATARGLNLPIEVLQNEGDEENRYAFVLIN